MRREGRITSGQKKALDSLYPVFGVGTEKIDWTAVFGNTAPVVCEIGFGNGQSLAKMAEQNPGNNFFGIEVYTPGVGSLLSQIQKRKLDNLRLSREDAVQVFETQIARDSLSRVQVFFPDPWHKKRHHKRRLLKRGFLQVIAAALQPGGLLHVATDWVPYAEEVLALLEQMPEFENTCAGFAERPEWRPETKFECRGQRLGHQVNDLLFERV